jgi:5-formyltetrahydrofolate cyclo-ligase
MNAQRPPRPSKPELPNKSAWRAKLLTARRSVPTEVKAAESEFLATKAANLASAIASASSTAAVNPVPPSAIAADVVAMAVTVCCYVPFGAEPGSVLMLDALRAAGHEVLLPLLPGSGVTATESAQALHWAPYQGESSLVSGPRGFRQPADPGRGPDAISQARLVLLPALAVDHQGVRLGRGAGWYDRSLPLARVGAALVAVVRDDEVVDSLPAEPHDVLMTGVLTPHRGVQALPLS